LEGGDFFVVSIHSKAVQENLSSDILHFSAGGRKGHIPIPLTTVPIPNVKKVKKDILCSFVGSVTHPARNKMKNLLGRHGYVMKSRKAWTCNIKQKDYNEFKDILERSKFSLCPRGFGPTSYRLYESFQTRSIPIYIWDYKRWLPWQDSIDWEKIAIIVEANDINSIPERIGSMSEAEIEDMADYGYEIWKKYFTMEATARLILERL
jgi:hypothetical protein